MQATAAQHGTWQARALDGKTVCGAGTHGHPVPVVREVLHGSGAVLHQQVVGAKTNEIPVAQQLLSGRDLHGIVFTLDALHTQQATTHLILDQGGHSLLIAKTNQPTVYQEWFAAPPGPKNTEQSGPRWRKGMGVWKRACWSAWSVLPVCVGSGQAFNKCCGARARRWNCPADASGRPKSRMP
jgi:hypothetical protein